MKKISKKLLALLLVVVSVFALVACGNGDKLQGEVKIVLNGTTDTVYTLDLEECGFVEGDSVYDALVWLHENESVPFSATTSFGNSGFDAFINSIGDLNPAYGTSQYVALYHNVESQKDVSAWAQPDKTYEGTTIYYSGVGVGALELQDELIVYFTILSY